MRFYRIPWLYRVLFPEAVFRIKTSGNDIYLTFDDGPAPGVTENIISLLRRENVPATFFCNGVNYERLKDLSGLLKQNNFAVANHGYSHLSGWKTGKKSYLDDVTRGFEITGSLLYRPPYGQIRISQYRELKKEFRIIFWDLMLYDFDSAFPAEKMLDVLKRKVRPGSILLLHDNMQSKSPAIIEKLIGVCRDMGFSFGNLDNVLEEVKKC